MGRWSQYDSDSERLPEGMTRIGYDADDQTYTYRDSDGSIWQSAPGNRYGALTCISRKNHEESAQPLISEDDDHSAEWVSESAKSSWRVDMMPLLQFLLIVGLFLFAIFWFLKSSSRHSTESLGRCGEGSEECVVVSGDTCWGIAESRGLGLEDLLGVNEGIDCDGLAVGQKICVPGKQVGHEVD